MIDPEQKELSDYIKRVHLSLRCQSRAIGAEKAWEEHLRNESVLRKYAFSMKKLAEEYWTARNNQDLCRIKWVVDYIVDYFQKDLCKSEVEKELRKIEVFREKKLTNKCNAKVDLHFDCNCITVLDVGSCYNPFGRFEFLKVFPIDLYPACAEVKKCNFVEVKVTDYKENWFIDNLTCIPRDFFDVVVFSLFLEYLPSPKQRYDSCLKAYECLKTNGLLIIVTPDSKHATANAPIMKSWKIAAASIGFVRTKLEKLKYLYCMVFRKSVFQKYPILLYNIKEMENKFDDMFIIPQDFVEYSSEEKAQEKSKEEEEKEKKLFDELPWF